MNNNFNYLFGRAMDIFLILFFALAPKSVLSLGEHTVQYIGPSKISEGDPFVLSCVTPFHDSSSWTVNGTVIITEDNILGYELFERRLYSFYREMILRVVSAQLYQTGEYRCNGKSRDYHFIRVVEGADAVTKEPLAVKNKRDDSNKYPKRYSLEVNSDYEFSCDVEEDDYSVLWYKNAEPIDIFTHPNIELYDKRLMIHNAQVEDTGEYACRRDATFNPGERDIVSRFLLTSPAKIVEISENQNIIKGRSMTLYCRAKGYPIPRITWYIGNMNAYILKDKDIRISVYSRKELIPNSYLTVRNMSYSDRGLYTCRAENAIGLHPDEKYHEKSTSVYVRENIIEPNEDEPGMGKILVPGEPLVLQCKTEECAFCSIIWFKDGEKLTPKENYVHINEENNSLTIYQATVNDTGIYECAVNRELINVDLRANIHVRVCEDLLSEGFTITSICEFETIKSSSPLLVMCSELVAIAVITVIMSMEGVV